MSMILAALALGAFQGAPAASADHSQHSPAQHAQPAQPAQHQQGGHAQHQAKHECCTEVDGKKVCKMMQGHGDGHGQEGHQGHSH